MRVPTLFWSGYRNKLVNKQLVDILARIFGKTSAEVLYTPSCSLLPVKTELAFLCQPLKYYKLNIPNDHHIWPKFYQAAW